MWSSTFLPLWRGTYRFPYFFIVNLSTYVHYRLMRTWTLNIGRLLRVSIPLSFHLIGIWKDAQLWSTSSLRLRNSLRQLSDLKCLWLRINSTVSLSTTRKSAPSRSLLAKRRKNSLTRLVASLLYVTFILIAMATTRKRRLSERPLTLFAFF